MRFLASLLALAHTVAALPTYSRTVAPKGWTLGEQADGTAPVAFTVALKQRNLDQLNRVFESVADPESDEYRNFLTQEQILDIVQPSAADRATVKKWLKKNGVSGCKDLGDALDCQTTVSIASSLFRTFFHTYTSTDDSNMSIVRSYGTYSVDAAVEPLIEMITGIASFPIPHLRSHKSKGATGFGANDQGVVAQSLEKIYGVPLTLGLNSNTSQGVIEFEGESFNPADLTSYATQVAIKIPSILANDTVGPNDPSSAGTEATLDVDMMMSLNHEAQNWFWIESGNGWLYTFATHFFSTTYVPQVVSISYGWSEADQCSINPDECSSLGVNSQQYVARVNTEFQKIGLRGVTLLSASGDSGANGRTDEDCSGTQLFPDFPGSSPYVTSVGATELANPVYSLTSPPPICTGQGFSCPSGGTEQAVSYAISDFASGGGFSNVAAQPSYQANAVSAYLKSGVKLPTASFFNATSRGYPDVAAIGHNNLIYQDGVQAVGGTSASAPIWGAVISLLNQAAIKKSGKPLGFVNPLLYTIAQATPSAFKDITIGDNKCTESGCSASCQGFLAAKGWDPVTGLGAPNFPALLAYVQNNL